MRDSFYPSITANAHMHGWADLLRLIKHGDKQIIKKCTQKTHHSCTYNVPRNIILLIVASCNNRKNKYDLKESRRHNWCNNHYRC